MTRGGASRPPTVASGFSLIRRHQYPIRGTGDMYCLAVDRVLPFIAAQLEEMGSRDVKIVLNSRETQQNVGDMHGIRTLHTHLARAKAWKGPRRYSKHS